MQRPHILHSDGDIPESTPILDTATSALGELFYIENPTVDKRSSVAKSAERAYISKQLESIQPVWIHYIDQNIAIKTVSEDLYYTLRTSRNRNLILPEEQEAYRDARIGIAGLSVGSTALATIVQTGGPKYIKIADPDVIEITNLNRIEATLLDVGKNKTAVAARRVWEVDPFAELGLFEEGIDEGDLPEFLEEGGMLDVFIDEMDSIPMKIKSRLACRKRRIPVIMATDNGDSVILDVERYDIEPDRPLFHGQISEKEFDFRPRSSKDFIEMANKIIDPLLFTKRQLESVQSMGATLSGIAQIGTAARIAGATLAYTVRVLATKQDLPSGRYVIGCDGLFNKG